MSHTKKILLLGSGELGREFVISAKRLGCHVVACDSYAGAPAMQMADECEVFSMLDGDALRATIGKHRPDFVVPEVEAIRTEVLAELEAEGVNIVPSARATQLTMNRDAIRDVAADELGLRTSVYAYAENLDEVRAGSDKTSFPCIIKPVMSSSGKGQSTVHSAEELEAAWDHACANMRGDRARVIVEQFVDFDYEITLLTIRHKDGASFCAPIGHRQERGDYQESWQPAAMSDGAIAAAQAMARKVVDNLAGNGPGYGLFGVEFFVVKGEGGIEEVIFSELSPRPHDTGMVTLVSQNLSEFDLHARAIMGLPIPNMIRARPSASAVILADRDSQTVGYSCVAQAMGGGADIRIFGKPTSRPYRRMGVALVCAASTDEARKIAAEAADKIRISYGP